MVRKRPPAPKGMIYIGDAAREKEYTDAGFRLVLERESVKIYGKPGFSSISLRDHNKIKAKGENERGDGRAPTQSYGKGLIPLRDVYERYGKRAGYDRRGYANAVRARGIPVMGNGPDARIQKTDIPRLPSKSRRDGHGEAAKHGGDSAPSSVSDAAAETQNGTIRGIIRYYIDEEGKIYLNYADMANLDALQTSRGEVAPLPLFRMRGARTGVEKKS